ncbi:MAG: GNAT family N-acetyltransferase [Pauljensenia sp.]
MDDVVIRELDADRSGILETGTWTALNWENRRFTLEQVRSSPDFRRYTRLLPERGDFALVAEGAGTLVGVVSVLFLPEEDAGYGWIAPEVPELSLSVMRGHRHHGWGRRLLRAALDRAAERGVTGVSLSVEPANRAAVALYRSEGFIDVPGREEDGVMAIELAVRKGPGGVVS